MRHYIDLVTLLYENASVEDYRVDQGEVAWHRLAKMLNLDFSFGALKFIQNIDSFDRFSLRLKPVEIAHHNIEFIHIVGHLGLGGTWLWYARVEPTASFKHKMLSSYPSGARRKDNVIVKACNQINAAGTALNMLGISTVIDDLSLNRDLDDDLDIVPAKSQKLTNHLSQFDTLVRHLCNDNHRSWVQAHLPAIQAWLSRP
jgi:hypothetical protein